MSAYLYTFITTDAANDAAAGLRARLQAELTDLTRLDQALRGLGGPPRGGRRWWPRSEHARRPRLRPRRAATAAEHQMSEAEEGLAADLRLTGGRAWARLHGEITSRLTAPVAADGERRAVESCR